MKFITSLLLLLILNSVIDLSVYAKRHSRRIRSIRMKTREMKDNIVYQFVMGFIKTVAGNPKVFDECSKEVKGWETSASDEEKTNQSANALQGDTQSTLSQIIAKAGKAIDTICNFKEHIISFMTKQSRRYIRLFLLGKISKRMRWDFGEVWNKIKTSVNDVGDAVIKGANKIGKTVVKSGEFIGKKAEDLYAFVANNIKAFFQPLVEFLEKIKGKIVNWLTESPMLKTFLNFAKCFYLNNGVKAIKTFYVSVESFVNIVPKLATPAGWIELVVHLICGWEVLKEGFDKLSAALSETNPPKRFGLLGEFTGSVFLAIAS